MLRRRASILVLAFAALYANSAFAKRHPVQHTIEPRVAVHYYRLKPQHRTFTEAAPRWDGKHIRC